MRVGSDMGAILDSIPRMDGKAVCHARFLLLLLSLIISLHLCRFDSRERQSYLFKEIAH